VHFHFQFLIKFYKNWFSQVLNFLLVLYFLFFYLSIKFFEIFEITWICNFKSAFQNFFFFRKKLCCQIFWNIFLGKGRWNWTLRNGSFREKIHNRRYRPVFRFGSVSPQNRSFLTETELNRTVHIPTSYLLSNFSNILEQLSGQYLKPTIFKTSHKTSILQIFQSILPCQVL